MPTKCQDCNTSFVLDANNIAQGTGCPNCGSNRLERDQPSPTHSDGDLRNMYDTAEHEDMGGNPLAEGTIMGSDGERPAGRRDNYMHSKTADFDNFLDDDWDTPSPSHRMVVTRDGQVFSAPLPATHEQIAQMNGLTEFPRNLSLGEKYDDGSTNWLQHESGHDSASLARLMENHFGAPVNVDPALQPQTNEERWFGEGWQPGAPGEQNLPNFLDRKLQEAEAVKQRGRPFPYYENPYFNRGGSVTGVERHLNMEPYTPWMHIADEMIVPEGDGTTVMVRPHPEAGFHFGPIGLVGRLPTVTVNGIPVANNGQQLYNEFGPGSPRRNDPLEISSYHPAFTNLAKRIIEEGHGMPAAYKDDVAQIQAAIKAGQIPPPPKMARTTNVKTAGPLAELVPLAAAAAPQLMRGALRGIGSNLIGDNLGGQQESTPQPTVNPLPLSSKQADIETPSSVPSIGEHDDPEAVDTKEFDDGDMDPNFENSNLPAEAGGSFAPNSQAIERMHLLGPLLMHYYHSDDSGANDPMIRELHNMMEQENPGYLDRVGPEHEEAMQRLLEQYRQPQGVTAAEIGVPAMTGVGVSPPQPGAMGQGSGPHPPTPNRCPYCGGTTTADGTCPQCGAKNGPSQNPGALPPGATQTPQPYMGKVAGPNDPTSDGIDPNQQGPKTPEQIAAVQQLLIDEGRVNEVPLVVERPYDYAKELAQVANRINQPENVAPDDVTQPQPAMEETPPGAGMPMPPPQTGVQPMASVTAADSVAPRCPKCHSGTTKIVDSDGECACHSCGNVWKINDLIEDKIGAAPQIADRNLRGPEESLLQSENWPKNNVTITCPHCGSQVNPQLGLCPMCGEEIFPDLNVQYAKTAQDEIPEGNTPAVPAAERHHPHDDRDIDQTRSWLDDDGNPLQRGMEYEMHNPSYRIPDIVTINAIKPDGITVTTEGEYDNQGAGLDYTHDISREEVQTEGITFVPINDGTEVPEQEPSQMDDSLRVNTEPTPSVQTPMVQQHSHVNQCSHCGEAQGIVSSMSSPTTRYHECYRCGNGWETLEKEVESDRRLASREWLNEDSDDGFWNGYDRIHAMETAGKESRNLSDIAKRDPRNQEIKQILASRTAGKKFSPSEQREFIEETGEARNSDLLDLEGTHYKTRDSSLVGVGKTTRIADGDNVREEDLFLGI